MFSRILAAILVIAVTSPVAVLAQNTTESLSDFAESITAIESLIEFTANTPGAVDAVVNIGCIALNTASNISAVAVTAAKGKPPCPAAAIACGVASNVCSAARCSGCVTCPTC